MIDFNQNTSKTWLKQARIALTQRAKNAMKQLKSLKAKEGWSALLKPYRIRPPRRSRAGLNLFEATLWTMIAITLLVSILTLYNGAVDSTRTAALRAQLTRAVAIIERDHSRSGTYTATSLLGFLNDEGFSEKELHRISAGNYEFTTPYDTDITIAPDTDDARHFVVTVNDLPPSACEATVSSFSARGSGLDSAKIGENALIIQSELTDAKVSEDCDVDDTTTVVLTF